MASSRSALRRPEILLCLKGNQVLFMAGQRRFLSGNRVRYSATVAEKPLLAEQQPAKEPPPLSLLPTKFLLRSLLITSVLASPALLKPVLKAVGYMAHSNSALLNPDRNPVLHAILKPTFYDHFAAGENETQVKRTVASMKNVGFKGVILGYAKEIVVDSSAAKEEAATSTDSSRSNDAWIEGWKDGTLRTARMIGEGDFLGIKFTGAGPAVTEALALGKPPPPKFWDAMNEIAEETIKQGSRLWIDAEQQVFQDAIDAWTIDLMRKYNQNGKVYVYNTLQAYLKRTPENIRMHLALAKDEGWGLGIKLVRGAYIAAERREAIHDTKEDTDNAYNTIVANLLTRSYPQIPTGDEFPTVALFLASHNGESVRKAVELRRSLVLAGKKTITIEFGQLQGMADDVSCMLLQKCQQADAAAGSQAELERLAAPRGYKCLAWGTTQELLGFLLRRAVENMGALDRTKQTARDLRKELRRRLF